MTDDLTKARIKRAEILGRYKPGLEGFIAGFEASWRKVWAEDCRRTGKTVSFEEWFYTDVDGECPFEVAGGWFFDVKNGDDNPA